MPKETDERQKMKKWQVAQVYRAYLSREGPQNLGTVQWPKAKPGALKGLKMLSTGVFETIERSDLIELLEGSGAHYYAGMSPHLHYLLVGRDAGPVKLQVAEQKGIPQLTEEQFHTWITEKIENHVPSAEDLEEAKSGKRKKSKAAVIRPKPEPKPRKAPAKRQPLPKQIEYDSDESMSSGDDSEDEEEYDSTKSSGSEEVSDDEVDDEEEPVTPVKKSPAKKQPQRKKKAVAAVVKTEASEKQAVSRNRRANGVKQEPKDDDAGGDGVHAVQNPVAVKKEKSDSRSQAAKRTAAKVKEEPKEPVVAKKRADRTAKGSQKEPVTETVASKRPRRACKQ